MSIVKEELNSLDAIANYLSNLKKPDNSNFFGSVTRTTENMAGNSTNGVEVKIDVNDEYGFLNIGVYNNTGVQILPRIASDHTTITYTNGNKGAFSIDNTSMNIAYTEAYSTKNGCCIIFRNVSGIQAGYVGYGLTVNGKVFGFAGKVNGTTNLLSISNTYLSPAYYAQIENSRAILNQVTLIPEAVSTETGEYDLWNKIYYNKTVQYNEIGIMTLNGKSYFTNGYISILDD